MTNINVQNKKYQELKLNNTAVPCIEKYMVSKINTAHPFATRSFTLHHKSYLLTIQRLWRGVQIFTLYSHTQSQQWNEKTIQYRLLGYYRIEEGCWKGKRGDIKLRLTISSILLVVISDVNHW